MLPTLLLSFSCMWAGWFLLVLISLLQLLANSSWSFVGWSLLHIFWSHVLGIKIPFLEWAKPHPAQLLKAGWLYVAFMCFGLDCLVALNTLIKTFFHNPFPHVATFLNHDAMAATISKSFISSVIFFHICSWVQTRVNNNQPLQQDEVEKVAWFQWEMTFSLEAKPHIDQYKGPVQQSPNIS